MLRIHTLILASAVLAGSIGLADEVVDLEDCPEVVQGTINSHLGGGAIKEIERTTDHGRVLYEVDVLTPGGVVEFDVTEDGTFLLEPDADDQDDPEDEADVVDAKALDEEARQSAARAGISLTPLADGVAMSPRITHPYLPLSFVRSTELMSEHERVLREVQDETRTIEGVECLVLAEKEYEDDDLAEISYNYFAQDRAGNVYYFGEEVDEYEDGKVVSHGGAWLVGRNAHEPCLFMAATLTDGLMYKAENVAPSPQEWDQIVTTGARIRTPSGGYEEVLVVQETDHPGRWQERKYYAKGVGLVSENEELNLVMVHAYARPGDRADAGR